MVTFIAIIVLISSLLGAGLMMSEKMPLLLDLPETAQETSGSNFILTFRERIKTQGFVENFSYDMFLQKLLSRVKTLALKTENKTSHLLQKLREKSKQKKVAEEDNYWEEIKKSTHRED